jgi:hypothetical protein
MGKTSLSRAVLHHPDIASKFEQHRLFVACDTVSTSGQLAALIAAHIGLKAGNDSTQPIIRHFMNNPSLLILDNLETIWEPMSSRGEMEKLLGLLTDVEHLALIVSSIPALSCAPGPLMSGKQVTMRGAERPANIRWTRPFLEPLKPLPMDAARQTFSDITDNVHDTQEIDEILALTDNMPLAINLIAYLVDYEGLSNVLTRWETDRTSILSDGYDKKSNLELSISVSLSSPRIASAPDAQELLSLLSMLPDGLSDVELLQSKLPLASILACKSILLSTSLAYLDDQKRLRTLVPIREYVQKRHPPSRHLTQPIFRYFQDLLQLHSTYSGTLSSAQIVPRIRFNLANIQNVLSQGLQRDNPDLVDTIYSTCDLDLYSRLAGHGKLHLLDRIPAVLPTPKDPKLEVYYATRILSSVNQHNIRGREIIEQALEYFPHVDDVDLKCKFIFSFRCC